MSVRTGTRGDAIHTLWDREAPPTVKTALAATYVFVGLLLLALVVSLAFDPSGSLVLEYLAFAAVFVYLATRVVLGVNWARIVMIALAAVFLLASIALFQSGVPGVVQGAGVLQVVLLLAVVVSLLLRGSSGWFRAAP